MRIKTIFLTQILARLPSVGQANQTRLADGSPRRTQINADRFYLRLSLPVGRQVRAIRDYLRSRF